MKQSKIAILDLGTNTFHLLIANISKDGFVVSYKEKIPVKIGQGGINRGIITQDAFNRAIDTILLFREIINREKVDVVYAVATSAIRCAKNGKLLIDTIWEKSGIEVKTISGDREAEYIYSGVRQCTNMGDHASLIMDIGGGSVEFIIGNQHTIYWKKSFEIGAQRLFDLFHKHDPVTEDDLIRMNKFLEKELTPLFSAITAYHPRVLIGSSGTFDTLSDIYCIKRNIIQDPLNVERPISIEAFFDIYDEIIPKNRVERLSIPGMAVMRADMIVMAVSLARFVIIRTGITRLRASSYSLKEGILYHMLEKQRETQLSA